MTDHSNTGLTLKDYCDRWEVLDDDRNKRKDDLKEKWEEMKGKSLPVAEIKAVIAQEAKDKDKLATHRDNMKNAGELVGVTVYVGEVTDPTDDPYQPATITFARQCIAAAQTLTDEIKGIGDDIKVLLKAAKSEGFEPALIPTVVGIRRDPAAYHASNTLLETYLTAVGVPSC